MDNSVKLEADTDQSLITSNSLNKGSCINTSPNGVSSKSTLLCIAVEYSKESNEYKFTPTSNQPEKTSHVDIKKHARPSDANKSSVAHGSPAIPQHTKTKTDVSINSTVVVKNFVSASASGSVSVIPPQTKSSSVCRFDRNLIKQSMNNKYVIRETSSTSGILQLVSRSNVQHKRGLLITDQVTGISYNIKTQEYVVQRYSTDQHKVLAALKPENLLDNDSDDTLLKSQRGDVVASIDTTKVLESPVTESSNPDEMPTQILIKTENVDDESDLVSRQDHLRRSQRQIELQTVETEEQLLSDVQTISDKPIETRAKASLPALYLSIVKQTDDQYGVTARKMIPKCTQFGPAEGTLVENNCDVNDNTLRLLLDCGTGPIQRLDMSDENVSNWMCFVRKANTFTEQNLVAIEHKNLIYYVTTANIMPKQELLVGYSAKYAKQYNLPLLEALPDKNRVWRCFECGEYFQSSADLQSHLNIHDGLEKRNIKLKKKILKRRKVKIQFKKLLIECKLCMETFSFSFADYDTLKKHLMKHRNVDFKSIEDKFGIISYNCEKCGMSFESEVLLEIHHLQHKVNNNTEIHNLDCPKCQTKFDTLLQLIKHVNHHDKYPSIISGRHFKCPICYKRFASDERIQRHMFVHGSDESKPFKCETCNKGFLNNSALTCHLKTHSTDRKQFECPMCKDSFEQVIGLKLHVAKHRVNGKYTCPHCKKIFNEYSVIRKHIRAFHCDRKHCCSYCGKPFPTLDKLRMHLLRHSDHREFLCADCGKQFKRKDKLKEHTKRMHAKERENIVPNPENTVPKLTKTNLQIKRFIPKVVPTDYHRFIYKCHACLVGFKRRGMLVNHLAKRHPDISPDSVPELNLPILRTTRDYYCQYCDKIYKSSSKRKAHILKIHPGQALPLSNRRNGTYPDISGLLNPTFSQTVGSITTPPQSCQWCHKQYASKAKLLQHQRKKHIDLVRQSDESKDNLQLVSVASQAGQNQNNEDIVIDTFKKEIKVSSEEILSEARVVLLDERDERYYKIVSVPPKNAITKLNNSTDLNNGRLLSPDSRLYRLLTTGNGLLHHPR